MFKEEHRKKAGRIYRFAKNTVFRLGMLCFVVICIGMLGDMFFPRSLNINGEILGIVIIMNVQTQEKKSFAIVGENNGEYTTIYGKFEMDSVELSEKDIGRAVEGKIGIPWVFSMGSYTGKCSFK